MKLSEILIPSLCSLSFSNFTSKHPESHHHGVDFSDPSVSAALSQTDQFPISGSSAHKEAPLRAQLNQGPAMKFKVHSSRNHVRATECPQPPVLSCSAAANSVDTCCVLSPGGILVHTQFWDLNVGQPDSWGIHGLWPDKCNGAFYENCDNSRAYSASQIVQSLQNAGAQSTLDIMNEFWLSDDESPEAFWEHEWKTHGTCVSTLEPRCFEQYTTAQEVAPYFETVVKLFQQLNTYQVLSNAGIAPSADQTYNLGDLQNAVLQATGYTPDFVCKHGALSSVQYYLRAQGPVQDGNLVQSNPSRHSNCPHSGIKYPLKTVGN